MDVKEEGRSGVQLVQQTLGHGSLKTTSICAHAKPGDSSALYRKLKLHRNRNAAPVARQCPRAALKRPVRCGLHLIVCVGWGSSRSELSQLISKNWGQISHFPRAIFLVTDFAAYWLHRWFHSSPTLWEAHKVHHSATDLHILLAFRFHPIELLFAGVFLPTALFFVLGASMPAVFAFTVIDIALGQIQHARLNWGYGWLGYILVSPNFHRTHHSLDPQDHNKNFGGRLVFWDKLFGTYSPRVIAFEGIGVDDHSYMSQSITTGLIKPYKALAGKFASLVSVGSGRR